MTTRVRAAGLIMAALLTGCGGAPPVAEQPTVQPTATMSETSQPEQGQTAIGASGFTPPPTAICEEVRKATAETLAVDVTASEEPFQDHAGSSGSGCLLTATGTGEHFGSFLDTAAKLNTMFTNLGWIEDQAYLADGPTGTATAHRKDSMLAMVAAGWSPAPDVECPQDQPISGCEVPPTKQLFTITVRIGQAQRG